jgi:hypothetical protein
MHRMSGMSEMSEMSSGKSANGLFSRYSVSAFVSSLKSWDASAILSYVMSKG